MIHFSTYLWITYYYKHIFFRKQEHIKFNENKIEAETTISSKNKDETKLEKILFLNNLFTDTVSQPLETDEVVNSDCKVKSKLSYNVHTLSTDNPTIVTNFQLASEQYINIFNRYQVFHVIMIFSRCIVTLMIIFY